MNDKINFDDHNYTVDIVSCALVLIIIGSYRYAHDQKSQVNTHIDIDFLGNA